MSYGGTFTAGLLVRHHIRRFLEECEFNGTVEKWRESKGFLDSEFFIKGMAEREWRVLNAWAAETHSSHSKAKP